MHLDDEREILALMRAARAKARGYADFFGWAVDRDLEEWGVVSSLSESLELDNKSFFADLKYRGRPNDPPDCEALSASGQRIAIEVTELVDGEAIRAFKEGRTYDGPEWNQERFLQALARLVTKKDNRFPALQGKPYDGGYIVVVQGPRASRLIAALSARRCSTGSMPSRTCLRNADARRRASAGERSAYGPRLMRLSRPLAGRRYRNSQSLEPFG